ncbi:MAG: N-acetyl-gamma-glutamyl-phosphate reductase [Thermodesulfobacteriota bacterium]
MIRAGIIGATGYTGAELVRFLTFHTNAEITLLTSRQYNGQIYSDIYPAFRNIADTVIEEFDPHEAGEKCDVVFTALPHKIPMEIIPDLLEKNVKVVDLSADFRFNSVKEYEDYYCEHKSKKFIEKSVYGLSELYREKIKSSVLVGNPGCYPTCSLLGILPFLKSGFVVPDDIIIDAKSGASGAGRGLSRITHFCELNESFKAYKVASHRHRPEIEEKISEITGSDSFVTFTPHLIPVVRGMLATIYMKTDKKADENSLRNFLKTFYKDSQFVRILPGDEMPDIKNVAGTNYCDINLKYDENSKRLIVVSAIDNLVKGASGQAVQNMNIMFGLDEAEGLRNVAYPV